MTPALAAWDGFYVIVGSAAGAMIGLQFVVITLVAERPPTHAAAAGAAFATPTIVHLGSVLFLAALLHAPFQTITNPSILWGALGFGGVTYAAIVVRRMRKQAAYRPALEDWLFHGVTPLLAYGILSISCFAAQQYVTEALFAVAGAALLLLFTAIHNAWDAAAYHVLVGRATKD